MRYQWENYIVRAFRGLMVSAAIFFVIVAIVISLARIFTPVLNKHKDQFTHQVENFLQQPVTIGSISAKFSNFEPVFVFKNVTVFINPKENRYITVPNLSIGINILESILKRTLITGHITIGGVQLKAELAQNGKLDIYINQQLVSEKNTQALEDKQSSNETEVWSWLLNQHRLELKDIDIEWSRYDKEKLHLSKLDAVLVNIGSMHKLRGVAYVGSGNGSKVSVGLDIIGDANNLKDLKASMYFGGKNLPVGHWVSAQQYKNFTIVGGLGDVNLWADWANEQIQSIQTRFIVTDAKIKVKNIAQLFTITQLSGDVVWNNTGNGAWTVWADNIDFIINGRSWPTDKIGFSYDPNQKIQSLAISYLNLDDISQLLVLTKVLSDNSNKLLTSLQPQGELRDIQILHESSIDDTQNLSSTDLMAQSYLQANFSNLGIKTYQMYPGIDQLSGNVVITPQAGQVSLASKQNYLDLPSIFNNIIPIKEFNVQAFWVEHPKHWNININKFKISNDLFAINAQAGVKLDKADKYPELSALVQVSENDLSRLHEIIPTKILSKNLEAWLSQAFISGKGVDATIVYQGGLHEMPFKKHQGTFLAEGQLKELTLRYDPKWPVINDIDADMEFRNDSMLVQASNGKTLGVTISNITASIPKLVGDDAPVLIIDGQLSGDSKTGLDFVAQSPLQAHLSGLKVLQLTGPMKLDLNLYLPLVKDSPDEATKGTIELDNNTLEIPSQKLLMNNVTGKLMFTDTGVTAREITGTFFNYPATVNIKTAKAKDKSSIVNISIASHIDQKDLIQHFDVPLLRYLSGDTDYSALLQIPSKSDLSLTVKSTLKGMQIQLPPPYNKAANASAPFSLSATFLKENKTQLHLNYNKSLDAALTLLTKNNQTKLLGGQIMLGYGAAKFQDQPGLIISGYLPVFNWDVWQPYSNAMEDGKTEDKAATSTSNLIKSVTLKISELDAFNQKLKRVNLSLVPQVQAWQFKIASKTISGSVLYPDNTQKSYIIGNFKKLHLVQSPDDKNKTIDPSTIPRLDMSVDDFLYGSLALKGVHLKAVPFKNNLEKGLTVEQFNLQSKEIKLTSTGSWIVRNNKAQATHIVASAVISDLGTALQSWDVTDKFKTGSGTANFDLQWSDSPTNFKLKRSTGTATFNLTNGRIVDLGKSTESKIGIGKMINVLSVDSLLHLGDIGKGGYSYTNFTADMTIGHGQVKTNNAKFQGPVADIDITGAINLVKERYHLALRIEPHLTSSLPLIAGVVLVNPIVGALAWVADKVIVSPSVNAIAAVNYTVTGPFNDPIVQKTQSNQAKQQGKK